MVIYRGLFLLNAQLILLMTRRTHFLSRSRYSLEFSCMFDSLKDFMYVDTLVPHFHMEPRAVSFSKSN